MWAGGGGPSRRHYELLRPFSCHSSRSAEAQRRHFPGNSMFRLGWHLSTVCRCSLLSSMGIGRIRPTTTRVPAKYFRALKSLRVYLILTPSMTHKGYVKCCAIYPSRALLKLPVDCLRAGSRSAWNYETKLSRRAGSQTQISASFFPRHQSERCRKRPRAASGYARYAHLVRLFWSLRRRGLRNGSWKNPVRRTSGDPALIFRGTSGPRMSHDFV